MTTVLLEAHHVLWPKLGDATQAVARTQRAQQLAAGGPFRLAVGQAVTSSGHLNGIAKAMRVTGEHHNDHTAQWAQVWPAAAVAAAVGGRHDMRKREYR